MLPSGTKVSAVIVWDIRVVVFQVFDVMVHVMADVNRIENYYDNERATKEKQTKMPDLNQN
jgi:hypothetical protein